MGRVDVVATQTLHLSNGAASLRDVLVEDALTIRPSRAPRAARENQALRQLVQQMANEPEPIIQKLVELALEVCSAGSAGVSLLDKIEGGEEIFRWTALAGAVAEYAGGTTPAHWSPCGACLQRGLPTLFSYPARYFTYFQEVPLTIVEGLVVPLRVHGHDLGTIWVMQHTSEHQFDAEDARMLESLGALTAAAIQLQRARDKAESGKQQAEAAMVRAEKQEQALRESEERFRASFAKAAIGMVLTDLRGRFLRTNDCYNRLTGYRAEELVKLDFQGIIHPDDAKESRKKFRQLAGGKIPSFVVEERYVRKDGAVVYVRNSVSLARDANGEPASIIAITEDITARKRTEQQLQAAHEDLEQTAAELRRSNEDLEQFAYIASHDLKSPLKTVLQFTELLERRHNDELGPDAQDYLGFVSESAKRMAILIDDLLRYARVSAEDVSVPSLVDAEAMFKMSIENLKIPICETDALVTHDTLPKIKADPTRSIQLFQNLIANAIHYRGSEKPHVHISVSEKGNQWLFSVCDNGIGIEPQYWKAIFEPFKRLHGTDRPGSGIGLALCKKIVGRFGGEIWVRSKVGEGSTFYFTIPR